MRVLYVSSGLDPRTGGTATAAVSVCLAARRAGVECALAAPVAPDQEEACAPAVAALRRAGVMVELFPFAQTMAPRARRWGVSPKMDDWLSDHAGAFDLVHAHSAWVWSSVAAVRAARHAGRKALLSPHESLTRFDMANASAKPLLWAKRGMKRWYLSAVDRFVLSSDLERRDSDLERDPRAIVAPHPVFDELADAPPPRPSRTGEPFTAGFLGRFHPKKNLELLIDALAAAPGVRLRVAGDGPTDYRIALLRRAADRGVADRIDWIGFIDGADKAAFFAAVDVVAMPSAYECFGFSAAEAMVHGAPVILTPTVGVAPDAAAAGCAVVVEPTAASVAEALATLAADRPRAAALAARAPEAALALYSFAAHGRRMMEIYRALVG